MEFTNKVYDAVNRYFSVLSHIGYKSYSEVDKLLIMSFIEELLDGPMSQFVTEKDYIVITNGLYCLYGTCMIPFPEYKRAAASITHNLLEEYRITETGKLRASETQEQRVKS